MSTPRIGIATTQVAAGQDADASTLSWETRQLWNLAEDAGPTVLFNPHSCSVLFPRRSTPPKIYLLGDPIRFATLIVRRTRGAVEAAAAVVEAALLGGARSLDPPTRFRGGGVSKLGGTISRHSRDIGSDSEFAFTPGTAHVAVDRWLHRGPVVLKSITGRRGLDLTLAPDYSSAHAFIDQFWADNADGALIIQPEEEIEAEFRVVMLNGVALGTVSKEATAGEPANASQGSTFVAVVDSPAEAFAVRHVRSQGLLGVDVALRRDGSYFILEENYAPLWKEFQRATGVDVAAQIIQGVCIGT